MYNFAKILPSQTIVRTSNLYHLLLSLLDSNVPHQPRFSNRAHALLLGNVQANDAWKLSQTQLTILTRCTRQSLTNAVPYSTTSLVKTINQYRFIMPAPSFQGDSVANYKRTILPPRTTKRHKCRHLLPYSSLRSRTVNHTPPALWGRGVAFIAPY